MTMTTLDIAELLAQPLGAMPDLPFSSITADSRKIERGGLFVALCGENVDGHAFGEQACAKGAVAILGEREGLSELGGLPYIHVENARRTLALTAHAIQDNPSRALKVIGVTGTNGKSSTVYLIRRILETCGLSTAQFGTIGYIIGGVTLDAAHTTPFPEDLAAMFHRAKDSGQTHVVMEVSSHALEQERVAGIEFDAGVFTNLTQDHLDYHDSMEAYLLEKLKLFEAIQGEDAFTVVNNEDAYAGRFAEVSRVPCHRYGLGGDVRALDVRVEARSTSYRVVSPWGAQEISMNLLGMHNVSNALAAITVCGALGLPMACIARGVEALTSVPGRFEHIDAGQEFQVIVDYAHTEDGLRNVLQAAREICTGRVIVVFGCGGDRDKGKRPKMASVAAELADYSIVTSDNPRSESPERIVLDIVVGLQRAGKKRGEEYRVFVERAEAIQHALEVARPGDLVMLAGKGHEDYQIINSERIHFDDREVARNLLRAM